MGSKGGSARKPAAAPAGGGKGGGGKNMLDPLNLFGPKGGGAQQGQAGAQQAHEALQKMLQQAGGKGIFGGGKPLG
jgi:hypothetical protein